MKKIKLFFESEKGKDILVIIIVILVGIASFELGRLSNQSNSNGLKIENTAQEASIIDSFSQKVDNSSQNKALDNKANIGDNKGNYFASKRGKKYYPTTCSAGKTIKQENRIYFSTPSQAVSAGYELSSSCR